MKLLILLVFVAGAIGGQRCPPNSKYDSCGTSCPLTCDNFDDPPEACILKCNPGCHCIEGYVRAENGSCVLPAQCPDCPPNSHYNSCGTSCPVTCENKKNLGKACVEKCNPGCQCNRGYVLTSGGLCVLPKDCPEEEECPPNSHYEPCRTSCPLTCENFKNPPKTCDKKCNPGCQCDKGYVLAKDGSCVPPGKCPKTQGECGDNAYYTKCGSACAPTCDSIFEPPKACIAACVEGCQCVEGYVKTRDGRCVLPAHCPLPVVCGKNENYTECGTACPLTCDNFLDPPTTCPAVCVKECQCLKGFVRHPTKGCVRPKDCFGGTSACDDKGPRKICKNCCIMICN